MNSHFSRIESFTAFQVATLGVFSTWALGGGAGWATFIIGLLGSLAPLITLAAVRERHAAGQLNGTPFLLLLPLLAFNALVLLSTLQPNLRIAFIEGANVYVPRADLSAWPSSARPELALKQLWLFDAIALSCFNLLFAIRRKRTLRTVLLILATNALALAVFGSVQKFVGATGLFFGQIASPNTSFFASFIYHNHWGAFAVLMLAVCLGLLFNLRPWTGYRDFWHSPALAAVVAIFFLAVTIPLSASRSCSVLAVVLLAAALIHGLRRVTQYHKVEGKPTLGPSLALALTLLVACAALVGLTREVIETRAADTQAQIAQMQSIGSIGARAQLYGDTWRMACEQPWFGWGLGSYGTIFSFYNTLQSSDHLPQFYADAHSDWLQLFAETGAIGTLLFLGFLLAPLLTLRRRAMTTLPRYLFAGCSLILLYACIEFPFGNPAVTLTFWICYFTAVRWAQLDQRERAC